MKPILYTIISLAIMFLSVEVQAQMISTFAGNGSIGFSGDGGSALNASFGDLSQSRNVVDKHGNLYVADQANGRVRKIGTNGIVTTFAGGGTLDWTYDNVPATSADLGTVRCVAADNAGNIYIGSYATIRKVDTTGLITTILNYSQSYPGYDTLTLPFGAITDIKFDKYGNLYFIDNGNGIGKINTAGSLSLFSGLLQAGAGMDYVDGTAVINVDFSSATGICVDGNLNLYVADWWQVSRVDSLGATYHVSYTPSEISDTTSGAGSAEGASDIAVDKYNNTYFLSNGILYEINRAHNFSVRASQYFIYCQENASANCENCFIDTAAFSAYSLLIDTSGNIYCYGNGGQIKKITQEDQNKIAGIVSFNCLIDSIVPAYKITLYTYDSTNSSMVLVDSATTTAMHGIQYYEFLTKPTGNYTVKAELTSPQPANYTIIPSYPFMSAYWDSAFYWKHNNNWIDAQTYLVPQVVAPTTGTDTVNGDITSGEGKNTDDGIPVADMGVFLRDANSTIIAYTHTNAAGDYMFTNIPNGSYDVYPEAINYTTTPCNHFTLSAPQPQYNNANFRQHTGARTITPYTPTAVATITGSKTVSVYPNPATNELRVNGILQGDDIRLFDMTGRVVYTGVASAEGMYTFSVKAFAAGSYMLQVKDNKGVGKYNKGIIKQ